MSSSSCPHASLNRGRVTISHRRPQCQGGSYTSAVQLC
jgi:hypothetical protein